MATCTERWAIYDPGDVLVYIGSHNEEPTDCWEIYTGWASADEIEGLKKKGYRYVKVFITDGG